MDTTLKHYVLTGELERAPITRFADPGTHMMGFTRKRTEPGPTGQAFRLCVPVESYSPGAEQAGDFSAGDSVLVADKLKFTSWTTTDGMKKTSLAVLARLMKVLTPASVTTDDHTKETTPLSRRGAWKPHHREGWR
jgi:hypothetical protein